MAYVAALEACGALARSGRRTSCASRMRSCLRHIRRVLFFQADGLSCGWNVGQALEPAAFFARRCATCASAASSFLPRVSICAWDRSCAPQLEESRGRGNAVVVADWARGVDGNARRPEDALDDLGMGGAGACHHLLDAALAHALHLSAEGALQEKLLATEGSA